MKKVITILVVCLLSVNFLAAQNWGRGNGRGNGNGRGHRHGGVVCAPIARPLDMRIFDRDYRNFSYLRQCDLDFELRRYVETQRIASVLLWADQIRLLAQLYRNDRDRMDFLVMAYRARCIYDLDMFHRCATAFYSPRDRDDFYDFLHRQGIPCGADYAHRGRRF